MDQSASIGRTSVNDLRDATKAFIEGKDWELFHSLKNLALALSVEVAEIVEHFQWLTEEQICPVTGEGTALWL